MEARKKKLLLISVVVLLIVLQPVASKEEQIVLVHGACFGAWSWFKLIPLLSSTGYKVTAIDLTACGVDPRQVTDMSSIKDYFQPLTDFMASLPPQQKVMLVGHSLGGLAISYSMELFPHKISVAVFIAALMPGPYYHISTLNSDLALAQNFSVPDNVYIYGNGTNNSPTAFIFGPKFLRAMLLQLSPVEDWVLSTLSVRPTRSNNEEDMSNVISLTSERYGSVKRIFIVLGSDIVLTPSFQRLMIEKNPPTQVQQIALSDHMVMMSRPQELSIRLNEIAQSYDKMELSSTTEVAIMQFL